MVSPTHLCWRYHSLPLKHGNELYYCFNINLAYLPAMTHYPSLLLTFTCRISIFVNDSDLNLAYKAKITKFHWVSICVSWFKIIILAGFNLVFGKKKSPNQMPGILKKMKQSTTKPCAYLMAHSVSDNCQHWFNQWLVVCLILTEPLLITNMSQKIMSATMSWAHFLCLNKVSANERRRYICNVFSHWLRSCKVIDIKNGCRIV